MALLRCPVCQKKFPPEDSPAMPFCSERCRLADLGRWLGEKYGMPIEREEGASDEPPENSDGS
jgi:uncharacterized protein